MSRELIKQGCRVQPPVCVSRSNCIHASPSQRKDDFYRYFSVSEGDTIVASPNNSQRSKIFFIKKIIIHAQKKAQILQAFIEFQCEQIKIERDIKEINFDFDSESQIWATFSSSVAYKFLILTSVRSEDRFPLMRWTDKSKAG